MTSATRRIDFAPLPLIVTRVLLIAVSIALITHAISTRRRLISIALIAIACAAAVANAVHFYVLLARGEIGSRLRLVFIILVEDRRPRLSIGATTFIFIVAATRSPIAFAPRASLIAPDSRNEFSFPADQAMASSMSRR